MTTAVAGRQKHLPAHPCLVCGGHERMRQGERTRCWGFRSLDGYEHCTRPEHAGGIRLHKDGTYPHRLNGQCRCGVEHDETSNPIPEPVETDIRADVERRTAGAQQIWRRARSPQGTPVEHYLARRGLTLPIPPSIRYAPALRHAPSREHLPAMVSAIQRWPSDEVQGVHRAYLTMAGAKAAVAPQRMMLGPAGGGAVRLAEAGPVLVVSEGIETGLSVQLATGLPTWAALSANGIRQLVLPPAEVVGEVVIAADRDRDGISAASIAAGRWRREGRRVRLALPPEGFNDFNDLLPRAEAS